MNLFQSESNLGAYGITGKALLLSVLCHLFLGVCLGVYSFLIQTRPSLRQSENVSYIPVIFQNSSPSAPAPEFKKKQRQSNTVKLGRKTLNTTQSTNPTLSAHSRKPPNQTGQGGAAETSTPRTDAISAFTSALSEQVYKNLEYPFYLRRSGIGGRVLIRLIWLKEKNSQKFEISETSGHKALDQLALQAVIDALSQLPDRLTPDLLKLTGSPQISLPIEFRLRK